MSEVAVQIKYVCDHQVILRWYVLVDGVFTETPPTCAKCYEVMSKVGSAVIISTGHLARDIGDLLHCRKIGKGVWQQVIG